MVSTRRQTVSGPAAARRLLAGVTALAVVVGLAVQVHASLGLTGTRFDSRAALVRNVFWYFTVESNVLVGISTALLAVRPARVSSSRLFTIVRLAGVVAITITFAVFHVALAGLQDLRGAAAVADTLLHTVVPVLAVLGWVLTGPRGAASWRVAALTLVFPVGWLAATLVRGSLIHWYPYPFLDVAVHGYPRVLGASVVVGVLFAGVAALAVALDPRLPGTRPGTGRRRSRRPRGPGPEVTTLPS